MSFLVVVSCVTLETYVPYINITHVTKGGDYRGSSKQQDILNYVIDLQRSGNYKQSDGARFEVHFAKKTWYVWP